MNFLDKIIPKIAAVLGFIGFFILIGAVGNQDYADELGVYRSFSEDLPLMIKGGCLLAAGFLVSVVWNLIKDERNEE